jgi:hypothetical protein
MRGLKVVDLRKKVNTAAVAARRLGMEQTSEKQKKSLLGLL